MNFILIKIIFSICIVIFFNACHTFEHQNIFLQNNYKNSNNDLLVKNNKNPQVNDKKSIENIEMAPIDTPRQTEKVKKLTLQKKVKKPNPKKFNIKNIINFNEQKLVKILGKSDFIKEEGKLKNYQYYFRECFLDVFLLRKDNNYFVNYIETRPTRLNGQINVDECLKEINRIIN
tara:strand:- start:248 stop:772 length:525 start_codon:yes stop_codon:yes gene_type:complete